MKTKQESMRERLTHQLQRDLVLFANRQNKTLSHSTAESIAQRIMEKADLKNSAFQHKGTSWLARVLVDNLPAPKTDAKK